MSSVKLIVWERSGRSGGKLEIECGSHQEANRLARSKFRGIRTKIVDNGQRDWSGMRSCCDKMQEWYG